MFFLRYLRDNCIFAGALFNSLYLHSIIENRADKRYIVLDSFRGQTSFCVLFVKDLCKWFTESGVHSTSKSYILRCFRLTKRGQLCYNIGAFLIAGFALMKMLFSLKTQFASCRRTMKKNEQDGGI